MAEILVARLGEIALSVESTKGTKVVNANLVDGTLSKHRVYDLTYEPLTELHERATAAATLSRYSHLIGRALGKMTFTTELRQTASAGTEDAIGALFKAAGIGFSGGVYTPTSVQTSHQTLTIYAMRGSSGAASVRIGLRGAMANLTLVAEVGKPVMCQWEVFGVSDTDDVDGTPTNTFRLRPTDDVLNTITHETGVPAVFQGAAFTWGGATKRIGRFQLAMNNVVVPRDDVSSDHGVMHYVITDRRPEIAINPDFGLVADGDDWVTTLNAGTEVAVAWSLAQASPARTFAFSAPKAQIVSVRPSEVGGIAKCDVVAALNKNSEPGDNEFTLTIS